MESVHEFHEPGPCGRCTRSTGFIKPKSLNPRSMTRITTSERVSDLLISTVDTQVDGKRLIFLVAMAQAK
jgi:hypothetical protein